MSDKGIAIHLANGEVLRQVKSFSMRANFKDGPEEFEATLYYSNPERLRFLEMMPCTITIDGQPQLSGRIEQSRRGGDGTAVWIAGRDYLGDLQACHVDPSLVINKGDTLATAVLRAAGPAGIHTVFSSGNWATRSALTGAAAGAAPFIGFEEAKTDDFKPKPEESIWMFVRRLVARFGGAIMPDVDRGYIHLVKPNFDQEPLYSVYRHRADPRNNVITSEAHRNYREVPTFALIAGKQWDKKGKESSVVWSDGPVFIGRSGTIHGRVKPDETRPSAGLPDGAAAYRLFFRRSNDARTQEEVDLVFNRAIAEKMHNLLHYTFQTQGFASLSTGAIWTVDTMVSVDDEIADVQGDVWIASREFTYTESGGPTTRVECWIPETFNLTEPLEGSNKGGRGGLSDRDRQIALMTLEAQTAAGVANAIAAGYGYGKWDKIVETVEFGTGARDRASDLEEDATGDANEAVPGVL